MRIEKNERWTLICDSCGDHMVFDSENALEEFMDARHWTTNANRDYCYECSKK